MNELFSASAAGSSAGVNAAMSLLIDEAARTTAINRWALPDFLHIPIAAADEDGILYEAGRRPVGGG